MGHQVRRYGHRAVNTGNTNSIAGMIKSNGIRLLVSQFPFAVMHVPRNRMHAHWTQLMNWARLCKGSQIPFALIGYLGKKWNEPVLQSAVAEDTLKLSHHRLCAFDIRVKPGATNPSAACIVVASTVPMRGHSCKCKISADRHDNDLGMESTPRSRQIKTAALLKAVKEILKHAQGACGDPPPSDLGPPAKSSNLLNLSKTSAPPGLSAAYPTEERVRQKTRLKALRDAGGEPKRKRFTIEQHFDDCGADLSGLGADYAQLCADYIVMDDSTPGQLHHGDPQNMKEIYAVHPADQLQGAHVECTSLALWFLKGSESTPTDFDANRPGLRTCSCLEEFVFIGMQHDMRDDLVEFCGGEARVSAVCARRRLHSGGNFDILCGIDLNDRRDQEGAMQYMEARRPIAVIISTSCTPFGPWTHLNRVKSYDSWKKSYDNCAPHGRFCGRVALFQVWQRRRRDDDSSFLSEHPDPTTLYQEPPWPTVLADETVKTAIIHQCATGQVGATGRPVKKRTGMTSNEDELLNAVRHFQCDGRHEHDHPTGATLARLRLWTWPSAIAISDGIVKLVKRARSRASGLKEHAEGSFAAVDTSSADACGQAGELYPVTDTPWWHACPGCKRHLVATDPKHNRDPAKCKHPLVETIEYKCLGCRQRQPEEHSNHTYMPGECRHGPGGDLDSARHERRILGQRRTGAAPREPSIRPASSPASSAQPQIADGTDLASEDEQQAMAREAMMREDRPGLEARKAHPHAQSEQEHNQQPPESEDPDGVGRDRHPTPRRQQRSAKYQPRPDRPRASYPEEVPGPEAPRDWTRFDIGSSLAVLRHGSHAACLRELRKLHLRWWHAPQKQMRDLLAAVGLPQRILDMATTVVKTCRECRQWELPGKATRTTTFLPDRFNQRVEADILFVLQFMLFHLVDSCTRFHAGEVIDSKTEDTLLQALWTAWIGHHGPMEELVIDGEGGLNTERARAKLRLEGIKLTTRAPGQHASTAERAGQLIRLVIHLMIEQMVKEGIKLPIKMVACHAFFVLNAIFGKNGHTSYQAVYGRQPPMLPPIEAHCGVDSADGRQEQRVRQIAINSITQASALAQTRNALAGKSSHSGHALYEPGDYVDYHRPTGDKDKSGWRGQYRS